jgi:hypothetical protein
VKQEYKIGGSILGFVLARGKGREMKWAISPLQGLKTSDVNFTQGFTLGY